MLNFHLNNEYWHKFHGDIASTEPKIRIDLNCLQNKTTHCVCAEIMTHAHCVKTYSRIFQPHIKLTLDESNYLKIYFVFLAETRSYFLASKFILSFRSQLLCKFVVKKLRKEITHALFRNIAQKKLKTWFCFCVMIDKYKH